MKGRLKCGSGTERDTRCGFRGSSEVGSGQGAAFMADLGLGKRRLDSRSRGGGGLAGGGEGEWATVLRSPARSSL